MTTVLSSTTVNMPATGQTVTKNGASAGGESLKATIHKAAAEFESIFVEMMFKSMRDTVSQDALTGGGHGEEMFGSLLDREYATAVSKRGGLGLAKMIEKQLLAQEGGSGKGPGGSVGITSDEKKANRNKNEVTHENQQ